MEAPLLGIKGVVGSRPLTARLPGLLTIAVASMGLLIGCTSTTASPSPTVTVTQTTTVTAPAPQLVPQEPSVDPEVAAAITAACTFVDENEPSWGSLTEAGPYEGIPMDVRAVLSYAERGDDAYRGAYDRLDPVNLYDRGNVAYGMVFADIGARSGLSSALRFRAQEYLKDGQDYASLSYFWAAYTASVESQVAGCSDYIN